MRGDLLADGRETLEFISARLTHDQYAALSNAIEEGLHLRGLALARLDRALIAERLVARLRSRLARVLGIAWRPGRGRGRVWSRRVPGGRRNER